MGAIRWLLVGTVAAACTSFSAPESTDDALSDGGPEGGPDGGPGDAAPNAETGVPVDAAAGTLKVFITATGYADIVSATVADVKCTAEAIGRLPGKFVAWYPATGVAASARLVTSNGTPVDGPWFLVDGRRVVANRAALSNTASVPLENGIDVTAAGQINGTGGVWTGTLANGGIGNTCPKTPPTTGTAGMKNGSWTEQSFFTAACGTSLGLYCFQVE